MIRFATEADLERVNELCRQVSELHAHARPDMFKPGFCDQLRDYARVLIDSPEHDILVCEREGAISGMACVDYIDKPPTAYSQRRRVYHVNELCVDSACRRQGVASELIAFMREYARERGFGSIELDVWEFNREALAFYTAAGFETYRRLMEIKL